MSKMYACGKTSPCAGCTRVPDPEDCENKRCAPWRQWYIERWGQTRRLLRQAGGQIKENAEKGVGE